MTQVLSFTKRLPFASLDGGQTPALELNVAAWFVETEGSEEKLIVSLFDEKRSNSTFVAPGAPLFISEDRCGWYISNVSVKMYFSENFELTLYAPETPNSDMSYTSSVGWTAGGEISLSAEGPSLAVSKSQEYSNSITLTMKEFTLIDRTEAINGVLHHSWEGQYSPLVAGSADDGQDVFTRTKLTPPPASAVSNFKLIEQSTFTVPKGQASGTLSVEITLIMSRTEIARGMNAVAPSMAASSTVNKVLNVMAFVANPALGALKQATHYHLVHEDRSLVHTEKFQIDFGQARQSLKNDVKADESK